MAFDGRGRDLRIGPRPLADAQARQVSFEHIADRGEQRGHVTPVHPRAAPRVEHRLEFLGHEADVPVAAQDGRDHAGQPDRPGIVLHILGVDEHVEWPTPIVLDQVIDRDVDRVRAVRSFDLLGRPIQQFGPWFEDGVGVGGAGSVV